MDRTAAKRRHQAWEKRTRAVNPGAKLEGRTPGVSYYEGDVVQVLRFQRHATGSLEVVDTIASVSCADGEPDRLENAAVLSEAFDMWHVIEMISRPDALATQRDRAHYRSEAQKILARINAKRDALIADAAADGAPAALARTYETKALAKAAK